MKKILIANRGEIACRIIDSCKKLNLHSIAVYSDVDKKSKHVRKANESIHIGGSKAQDSYLSSSKIIDAAQKLKADAIHPGYGFLAENDQFAQQVINAGIVWIGPKPNTIVSMGNKDIARDLALKNNLPICPGLNNKDLQKEDLEKKCNEIGFPILVKASAGGGGIGMQIVKNYNELVQSIEKTKNLAKKAFGNSDIFLEKFIKNARHIEIQIFGFGEKKAVHFYERDCSIQRRFQKIIEESPAPKVEPEIINKMAESAVNFATNQKYEGAGTIEFIYDVDEKKFYFLEMNTRIQVEHPVTEAITNSDLVEMQIKFALGIDFDLTEQNKININYLHILVLQESESDAIQEIDSNLYNSISELIKNLKSEEYDGVKAKINQAMISMITDTTSALLKLRLEKANLENSNQSVLLNEEKYILDSKKEMLERRETILSGILNGKPHSLDVQ